jgi:hypothetical protein
MQTQITALAERVASLSALQMANHQENRRDIHRLNNSQQSLLDALTDGLERIGDKIDHRVAPVETSIRALERQWAKATGYAIGITGVGALVFQLVKSVVAKLLTS